MRRGFLTGKDGDPPDLSAVSPTPAVRLTPPIVPIPASLRLNPLVDCEDAPDAVNKALRNNSLFLRYEHIDIPDVDGGSHIITAGVYFTQDQPPLSSRSWKPLDRSAAGRYGIRETERAGKSMFSLDRRDPSGLIACERPLVIASLTPIRSEWSDAMEATFGNMPEETRRLFLSLHRGPRTAPGSIDRCGGVFNDLSRINHSCVPNVYSERLSSDTIRLIFRTTIF
ncbi:hypothetical protein FA95DRAFT_707321 [Auriscalpium vulgare]|uniref:Uncharacterized protein n=1 Tax=Auriscalpium vulgare TaxID=40419 RepID=A0ACB8RCG7_9AGAM|nr:hypothetical protein FA95DRAFT_707321 [Auriscalpium vulgare]